MNIRSHGIVFKASMLLGFTLAVGPFGGENPTCLAQATRASVQNAVPFTLNGLIVALRKSIGVLPNSEIVQAIVRRGVNFEVSATILSQLKQAGATPDIIAVVRGNFRGTRKLATSKPPIAARDSSTTPLPQAVINPPTQVHESTPANCSVAVSSDPAGASIELDGSLRGTTPEEVQISAGGAHDLLLQKDNFNDYHAHIDCSSVGIDPKLEEKLANITIVWNDAACSIANFHIQIGGRSFSPAGREYKATRVRTGEQTYSMSGTVICPSYSGPVSCDARGKDSIVVEDGSSYEISWTNTSFGKCSLDLH